MSTCSALVGCYCHGLGDADSNQNTTAVHCNAAARLASIPSPASNADGVFRELVITQNVLGSVEREAFNTAPWWPLEVLELSQCSLTSVAVGAFAPLAGLRQLSLAGNSQLFSTSLALPRQQPQWLFGVDTWVDLDVLDLSGTGLTSITSLWVQELGVRFPQAGPDPALKLLELNKLEHIELNCFQPAFGSAVPRVVVDGHGETSCSRLHSVSAMAVATFGCVCAAGLGPGVYESGVHTDFIGYGCPPRSHSLSEQSIAGPRPMATAVSDAAELPADCETLSSPEHIIAMPQIDTSQTWSDTSSSVISFFTAYSSSQSSGSNTRDNTLDLSRASTLDLTTSSIELGASLAGVADRLAEAHLSLHTLTANDDLEGRGPYQCADKESD